MVTITQEIFFEEIAKAVFSDLKAKLLQSRIIIASE